MQSNEEVLRIAKDWVGLYAPKNLREDSAELLITWVLEHDGGLISFSGLNRAVESLGDQVLVPEKSQRQKDLEKAARGDQHQRDEYFKTISPESQKPLVDRQKKATDAELKGIKDEISKEINNYTVTRHCGMDYAKTEYGQQELRKVLANHDTTTIEGAKRALSAVRAAKNKLNQ